MAAVQQQNNPSISLKHLTYSNYGVHKNAKYINQIKSANSFKNAYINWLTNIYNPDHYYKQLNILKSFKIFFYTF